MPPRQPSAVAAVSYQVNATKLPMKTLSVLAGAAGLAMLANALPAQVRIERGNVRGPWGYAISLADEDRAMIGVSTGSGGRRDTLGLLVTAVNPESPAAQAGIEEGDRLQSVNGVSLRISSADLEDEYLGDLATRRLVRELGKLKAGDEARLQVYRDGQTRNLTVKTVAAKELRPERRLVESRISEGENRAALGIGIGTSGSRRDTSGVLIGSVVDDGPADKARIEEGDRIASINGVDLRVPTADAGDVAVSSSRIRRLYRELEDVKPGDQVELRLIRGGQARTVQVTAVAQKDLPRGSGSYFFFGNGPGAGIGDGFNFMGPGAGPRIHVAPFSGNFDIRSPEIEARIEGAMKRLREGELRLRPRLEFFNGERWHDNESSESAKPSSLTPRATRMLIRI